jgi:hypothetical protein
MISLKVVKAIKNINIEKAGKPVEVLIVEDNPDEFWPIQ